MNVTIGGIARTVEITSFDKLGDVKVCMLTTTADGSVGFQQLNQEVVDTIYASFPVDTASGETASFEDGADNVPVRELKLNLEPYQNLNGYDSPWVGGAGKNKYNPSEAQVGKWINGSTGAIENASGYWVSGFIPVKSGDVIRTTNKGSARNAWYNSDKTQSTYFAYSGGGTGVTAPFDGFVVFTGQTSVIAYDGQFICTINDSDLTYEPYSNICPIYPNNGKNLLENVVTDDVKTIGGITYTRLSDGSVIANGTATAVSFYSPDNPTGSASPVTDHNMFLDAYMGQKLIVTGTPSDVGSANIRIMIGRQAGSSLANDIGSGATFTVSETGLWVGIRIENGTTVNNAHFYPMIRPVEITDSTYVPYNAIGITRTRANLCVPRSASAVGNIYNVGHLVPVKQNQTVYFYGEWTYTFSPNMYARVFNNIDETSKAGSGADPSGNYFVSGTAKALTMPQDGYVGICYSASVASYTVDKMMISYEPIGQYEPYTAERYYPISDNPVYGGTLEVETGVLTVTSAEVDLGSLTWNYDTSVSKPRFYAQLNGTKNGTRTVYCICSAYKTLTHGEAFSTITDGTVYINPMTSYLAVCVHDSRYTDATTFKNAVNGVQFVYELATPLVYQLTPVQVKTLLGYNNIWTDSGTVEVQYRANIGLYIQKIIGASEEDMVANQNIQANKYFFVGETLYLSTDAISAGQTIVVGTNCIKTNLADALNALNS